MNQEPRPEDQDQNIAPATIAQRAEEIALSDGRTAAETTDADYARAQAELARPLPTEQLSAEPTDGFRRADIASATPGTKAASLYDEDPQIGADLVEQGIQEAVHDEFVESGRETLSEVFVERTETSDAEETGNTAEPAQEKVEEEQEPLPSATFTEPAIAPFHVKKAKPPVKRRAVKPAMVIPAPTPVRAKAKAAKKSISRAKPKPSPQPKAMAQPKTKAKAKAPMKMKTKPKIKAKAKAAPKTKAKVAARRPAPKKTLPAKAKARIKAPAKTKAKSRAKARPVMKVKAKAKTKTKMKPMPKPKTRTKAKGKPQAKRWGR
jgi:peroxiredoxin Q/BCP